MNSMITLTLVASVVVLLSTNQGVEGLCCGAPCLFSNCLAWTHHCNDCTKGTPYCATGKCNIFGCNCAGKCRSGKGCDKCLCPKSSSPFPGLGRTGQCPINKTVPVQELRVMQEQSQAHLKHIFAVADGDRDGRLQLREAVQWVTNQHRLMGYPVPQDVQRQVQLLDKDADGYLTQWEIDGSN